MRSRRVPCPTCLCKWKSKWVGDPDQMRSSTPDLGGKTKKSERLETEPAQSRPHEAATYERAAASKQMNHSWLF